MMKMKPFIPILSAVALASGLTVSPASAQTPLGTQFTYQGQLKDGGAPFPGASATMTFELFDALTLGMSKGIVGPIVVPVTGGLFTVPLDFGSDVFDGSALWLEITVDGVMLSPRQEITVAPYALQTRGIFVDAAENVGIGTGSPSIPLMVQNNNPATGQVIGIIRPDETPGTIADLWFGTSAAINGLDTTAIIRATIEAGDPNPIASSLGFFVNQGDSPIQAMAIRETGNVGIGTTAPANTLHVVKGINNEYIARIQNLGGDGQGLLIRASDGIGLEPLLRVDANGSPRLVVTANGNVGIRMEPTAEALDVNGTIRSNSEIESTGSGFRFPDGTLQTTAAGGGGGANTLDQAYDQGGLGAGRVILADAGPVEVAGPDGLAVAGNMTVGGLLQISGSSITIDGTTGSERIVSSDALELYTSQGRQLRLEPAGPPDFVDDVGPNIIGGLVDNSVTSGVIGATIAGGGIVQGEVFGGLSLPNRVTDDGGTVSGGFNNTAGDDLGTTSDASSATVGGGNQNTASGFASTVGGATTTPPAASASGRRRRTRTFM